ncbi:beta-D-glucosyl crocetin beta-1,6-glucosyltransferase-like [Papaver somniferum]|uniref:beta-D-glucosyl crocetin beta-1,6-glucosyltransferase-like n=1 Tax=Papaver somniferum TaxID=3469 RepID=UPI000E6F5348|nr:beta-D-glucosyl crocetin beta-1,6-glucosyltransferase-like [Papaver somniferum]
MDSSKDEDHRKRIQILMFPWLAHGHISPFLELAKRLASKNFYIYFCSTPINLSSIEHQLIDRDRNQTRSIEVVELNLPSLPNLPPHYHTTKSLPHHLMPTLKKALDLSAPSFNNLLSTIQPDILIYDFIQPWAPTQASCLNIPAIQLLTTGAAFTSFFAHLVKKHPDTKFPFPSIYLYDHEECKFTKKSSFSDDSEDRVRVFQCIDRSTDIVLINTFKEIEEKYLDYLSSTIGKELVPVGPLLQNPTNSTGCDHEQENKYRELLANKEKLQ